MTKEEIEQILIKNGFNAMVFKHCINTIYGDYADPTYGDEGVTNLYGACYADIKVACVAVKLFGAKVRLTKRRYLLNSDRHTPFIVYVPGRN